MDMVKNHLTLCRIIDWAKTALRLIQNSVNNISVPVTSLYFTTQRGLDQASEFKKN